MSPSTTSKHWSVQQRVIAPGASLNRSLSTADFRLRPAKVRARRQPHVLSQRARRFLNILVATIGIIATAPIMLLVAILVKLTSPGPVIYKQARVGIDRRANRGPGAENYRRSVDHGGKLFTIYKFRTMAAGHMRDEVWAAKDDPRITRVGSVLRATRLDELPQFFNVLKGDMNIVGPRPEQPKIFSELRGNISRYQERQRVLPGITGLAQVNLGYDTSVDDVRRKVDLDLEYIERCSAVEDLKIMAKTMPVMVFRRVWM